MRWLFALTVAGLALLASVVTPPVASISGPATPNAEAWHATQDDGSGRVVKLLESLRPQRTGYVYYQWCGTQGLDNVWIVYGLDQWDDEWGHHFTPYRISGAACIYDFSQHPSVNVQFTRTNFTEQSFEDGGCETITACVLAFYWTWWSDPVWSGDAEAWLISGAHILYNPAIDTFATGTEKIQLMAHEFGHAMGLDDHTPDCNDQTVMTTSYESLPLSACGHSVEPWWPGHPLNDVCVPDAYLGFGLTRCY